MYIQPANGYSRRYNRGRYKKPVNPLLLKFEMLYGSVGLGYDILNKTLRLAYPWTIIGFRLTFDRPVTAVTTDLTVTGLAGAKSIASISGNGTNVLSFMLTTPISQDKINITYGTLSFTTVGILLGDSNGDKRVNTTDQLLVQAKSGQAGTGTNVIYDIDGNGVIDVNDVNLLKTRIGTTLA